MDLPLKFSRTAERRATHFVTRALAGGAVQSRGTPRLY